MKISKYIEQSPIFAINTAYEMIIPNLNKKLKKEGVNLLQGLVMTALFFEDDQKVTPSRLADLFKTTRGNMSHIISHLEYKGWVKRVLNPKDARQFHIELKPEGKRKTLTLIKLYDQIQNLFEKQLGVSDCQKMTSNIHKLISTYKNGAF